MTDEELVEFLKTRLELKLSVATSYEYFTGHSGGTQIQTLSAELILKGKDKFSNTTLCWDSVSF